MEDNVFSKVMFIHVFIIGMFLMVLSLVALFKGEYIWAGILFGGAILGAIPLKLLSQSRGKE